MQLMIPILTALVLGLLVKTNLIEDRVKKLGEHACEETEDRAEEAGSERDGALDGRPKQKARANR